MGEYSFGGQAVSDLRLLSQGCLQDESEPLRLGFQRMTQPWIARSGSGRGDEFVLLASRGSCSVRSPAGSEAPALGLPYSVCCSLELDVVHSYVRSLGLSWTARKPIP